MKIAIIGPDNTGKGEIADDLHERGIIDSGFEALSGRLEETRYIAKHLGAHVTIGVSTLPFIFPGLTDVVSSICKESWSGSWMLYEGAKKNFGNALVHLSVMPFCWMPRIGGLFYLLPMAAKDPEAALVYMYAVSKAITRKNPEELCELAGKFPPVKAAVGAYYAAKANCVFDFMGSAVHYFITPRGQLREKLTLPLHSWLEEKAGIYRMLDEKFQNLKHMAYVVSSEIVAPGLRRGAKG